MYKIAKFEKVSEGRFTCDSKVTDDNLHQDYKDLKLPKRATKGSAGYDFFAPMDIELHPGEQAVIATGIRCRMDEDWVLQIFPRSGLGFKYKMQLFNTVGIIDSDYYHSSNEGHIMIKIYNDSKNNSVLRVNKGEAFAQGIFLQYGVTIDDENDEHEIRNGGFGSTTK